MSDKRDPTNPFAPLDNKGWLDSMPRQDLSLCPDAKDNEIARLRAELAKAEARGYRRALEDAAVACEVEADKCDDAAKWGESRQYVADCKAASYAMRDRAYAIRKMGEKG